MNRFLGVLIILGIIIWGFLIWEKTQPAQYAENFDDATKADRCAEFKQTIDDDPDLEVLGYKGRLRQLAKGCF